ncbi:hypothetical protein [Psychrobacter sp. BF1]|uniref:hypothetical protein n=1 Tax=Psychrobacter sp. BF1 TaxID=2821147 RepID=UPI001C4DE76F|nr:hypothetical protein [Psychrobacter sp. BF1]
MDLTTLPTQSSDYTDASKTNAIAGSSTHDETLQATIDDSPAITLSPNTMVLAEVLSDETLNWRIHNCKISEKTVTQDLPMLFLYHYDSLDDSIKQAYPLTLSLLAKFNTPMTASEAATFIGIDSKLIASPWQVKVIGSLVVFSEALQLAVRLHWTNTGKTTEQLYTKDAAEAVIAAFKEWQFFGRIDVLYKNQQQTLVSIDEHNASDQPLLTFSPSTEYHYLPASHALTIIAKLEADKVQLPWFESAILERLG